MAKTESDPMPYAGGNVVRVMVPREIHFDLGKLQRVQSEILGRLGCMACCSGWDIRFELERSFIVDKELKISPVLDR